MHHIWVWYSTICRVCKSVSRFYSSSWGTSKEIYTHWYGLYFGGHQLQTCNRKKVGACVNPLAQMKSVRKGAQTKLNCSNCCRRHHFHLQQWLRQRQQRLQQQPPLLMNYYYFLALWTQSNTKQPFLGRPFFSTLKTATDSGSHVEEAAGSIALRLSSLGRPNYDRVQPRKTPLG